MRPAKTHNYNTKTVLRHNNKTLNRQNNNNISGKKDRISGTTALNLEKHR